MCYQKPAPFYYFVVLHCLLWVGCQPSKDIQSAEQTVLIFRNQISHKDYEGVYKNASSAFRLSLKQVNMDLFAEKMDRFGMEIGEPANFYLVSSTFSRNLKGETLITLTYQTRINGSVVSEEYVFILEREEYRLFNYKFDERL